MLRKTGFLIFTLLLACTWGNAQVITGKILADSTEKPIAATITTHSGRTTSNNNGEFAIRVSGVGDTIRVFAMGYKPFFYPVRSTKQEHLVIHLKANTILLNDVLIKAERNHQKDSLDRRRDYSQVFNYQPPKIADAFSGNPSNVPFAFVSIDLLTVFNALTKNSDPKYRMKKLLLKDEQADYAATRFNRSLVTRTVGLKSDSLNMFMDKYYPTVDWIKKAGDYDIIIYIKTKAAEFRRPGN
ncbi:MAG TPA: hypothetical protein VG367_07035 [Mucilaginibacter sp.]|jgi:hypothetical protein|nr:hypothetical protein [Mucilaginibacter sp.]